MPFTKGHKINQGTRWSEERKEKSKGKIGVYKRKSRTQEHKDNLRKSLNSKKTKIKRNKTTADPKVHKQRCKRQKEVQNRPKVKLKRSKSMKKVWKNSIKRQHYHAASLRPEVHKKRSKVQTEVANRPEVIKKRVKSQKITKEKIL